MVKILRIDSRTQYEAASPMPTNTMESATLTWYLNIFLIIGFRPHLPAAASVRVHYFCHCLFVQVSAKKLIDLVNLFDRVIDHVAVIYIQNVKVRLFGKPLGAFIQFHCEKLGQLFICYSGTGLAASFEHLFYG